VNDELYAIGGPHDGRTLRIAKGRDTLRVYRPTSVELWTQLRSGEDVTTFNADVTEYQRCAVTWQWGPEYENEPLSANVLIAEGTAHSLAQQVIYAAAQGFVNALSGWTEQWGTFASEMQRAAQQMAELGQAIDREIERNHTSDWRGFFEDLTVDQWSQENTADRCWRCDSTTATTNLGLCDLCSEDLKAAA